jgi:hypothetical protein
MIRSILFAAPSGDPQGSGFGIAVAPAQRAAPEIRTVSDKRIAPANPPHRSKTVGRTAGIATFSNKFGVWGPRSDGGRLRQRPDLVVSGREGPPRQHQENTDQVLRPGAHRVQVRLVGRVWRRGGSPGRAKFVCCMFFF